MYLANILGRMDFIFIILSLLDPRSLCDIFDPRMRLDRFAEGSGLDLTVRLVASATSLEKVR